MDADVPAEELWTWQEQYRSALRGGVRDALAAIGMRGRCEVLLVGFPATASSAELRVEPADQWCCPGTHAAVLAAVDSMIEQDRAHGPAQRQRRSAPLDQVCARALAEELRRTVPGNTGWHFQVSRAVLVEGYQTHVVVAVEAAALEETPRLPSTGSADPRVPPSLPHALLEEVVDRAWTNLRAPADGDRMLPLRVPTSDIVRGAAGRLVRAALMRVGGWRGTPPDSLLNAISALPYEGRAGHGMLILAEKNDPTVEVQLQLHDPVNLLERRTVRKLMEASDTETGLLVNGNGQVYGLGRVLAGQEESILLVSFTGRGAWDLVHGRRALLSVRDGEAAIPTPPLDIERFRDIVHRLLPNANIGRLVELAKAASRHHHGAMLIISSDAEGEATRLYPQSIRMAPGPLSPTLLTQLTSMDGAVLVDGDGRCHAVGVILDGRAAGRGDPARGSRFNNPIRYIRDNKPNAVVLVYSSDGGVDILPTLRPRVARQRVADAVRHYTELASRRPLPLPQVFEAWDDLVELSFYLSEQDCQHVNNITADLKGWCAEQGIPIVDPSDVAPDPEMDDSYWLS